MNLTISDHKLVSSEVTINDFTARTVSKNSKTYADAGGILDTLIMHYTAGRSALSSANYLSKPNVKASAHLVVGRDGNIYQLVPFDKVAWHAGVSSYGGRSGFNKYSIGIEMDNAGILTKAGNQYQAWFGGKYPEDEVIQATHRNETSPRYWQTYTTQQLEVVQEVAELLVAEYSLKSILGHEEIAPNRKQDPGPAFDLDTFRKNILHEDRSTDDIAIQNLPEKGLVDASKLNIRDGAGSQFIKVAQPLQKGAEVKILDEDNGWYKVETKVTGWVSKGYIDTQQ